MRCISRPARFEAANVDKAHAVQASSSVYATPDNSSPFSSSAGASGSGSVAKLVPSAKHDKFVDATSAVRHFCDHIRSFCVWAAAATSAQHVTCASTCRAEA